MPPLRAMPHRTSTAMPPLRAMPHRTSEAMPPLRAMSCRNCAHGYATACINDMSSCSLHFARRHSSSDPCPGHLSGGGANICASTVSDVSCFCVLPQCHRSLVLCFICLRLIACVRVSNLPCRNQSACQFSNKSVLTTHGSPMAPKAKSSAPADIHMYNTNNT